MDCMDNMEKLTFSSPFCLLGPLGPQNAGLRQKYAVKYKEQMKYPLRFQKQRVLQFKNLSGCRKFQDQRRYEFLSQTVEEAKKIYGSKTGLPSADLTKDGGGRTNLTYDISTLTMTKLFQV